MVISKSGKTFYFIRHGITSANLQKIWCGGDWDIELHPEGEMQAHNLANRIFEISSEFDQIFCSPMLRAQQTAQLINKHAQKSTNFVEGLREWRIGRLERTPWSEPLLAKSVNDWPNPEGGESVVVFKERVRSALMHSLNESERPLLVSHGAVFRVMLDLLNIPERNILNCALYKFTSTTESGSIVWDLTEY